MSYILILFKTVVLTVAFLVPIFIQGQSFNALQKAGDQAFAQKDYHAAMFYYADALEFKPKDSGLNYKYAEAARNFNAFEIAVRHYEIVIKSKEKPLSLAAVNSLGVVYKNMGNYTEAIAQLEAFIAKSEGASPQVALAQEEIKNCQWAMAMVEEPDPIKIEQLSRSINTAYSEFGAYPSGDTLYYSSYRFENEEDKHVPPRMISKVLYSLRSSKGRTMRRSFNAKTKHTAHTAFSLDGNRIYFTLCDYVNTGEIRCAIYYREKDKRRRWKTTPVKLSKVINLDSFTATQPAIGYDSILQSEVLFFASNRPGGLGGLDLWFSKLGPDKKFDHPINLSKLNTDKNDATPFYHNAAQTLYFSSEGHQGLGGYDLYKSKNDGLWEMPIEHLGYPLNTSYNDVYPYFKADERSGYFSSNRPGSFYLDRDNKSCCNDIYSFEWIEPSEVQSDPNQIADYLEPLEVPQVIENQRAQPEKLEDFLPLALYFDNDEPDKRTRRTSTKKSYKETFLKYFVRREEYRSEFAAPLAEEDRAEAESIVSDFFEENVKLGYDHLFLFSDILLKRLKEGEKVEIFIKGFTSPRAKSDYNLALSQRRISSLLNHFNQYQEGVFLSYLSSGQLKITEQPFGETTADSSISDELEDQRNSIYSVGAARERRVEIVEIKRNIK